MHRLFELLWLLAQPWNWRWSNQAQEQADLPRKRHELRWRRRHRAVRQNLENDDPRLLFLGDSITENWETVGKSVWQQYYEPRGAVNCGISGDRTQHLLWRLLDTDLGRASPQVVILLIGTNNSADHSAEQIAKGVQAIVDLLRRSFPLSQVLLLSIFPRGDEPKDPRTVVNRRTNQLLQVFANDESIRFLDLYADFLDEHGSANLSLMPDGLHLSTAGYETWARAMEPTLTSLLAFSSQTSLKHTTVETRA